MHLVIESFGLVFDKNASFQHHMGYDNKCKCILRYPVRVMPLFYFTVFILFPALLWTAPELMVSQRADYSRRAMGTQKGDVYSFAIILHEILYRCGLFRCFEHDEYIPPKSKFADFPNSI